MNTENLKLMSTMLGEVADGEWCGIAPDKLINIGPVHLIDISVKEFDLGNWVSRVNRCGFSACAVGHAIYDQRFRDLGFTETGSTNKGPKFIDDELEIHRNWDAVTKFFEINYETAQGLFRDSYYIKPEDMEFGAVVNDPLTVKERVDELLLIGEEAFNAKYKELTNVTTE